MAPQTTIQPLSRGRRRFYSTALIAVFVIAVPLLFLYATGYRFEGLTNLVKTGGIYVGAERSGAEIFVNGELLHETGTFRRAFFVQDLEPGIYTILVKKDGYHPWGKTLPVYAHIVTEAQAFNMPLAPLLSPIPQSMVNTSSTSTRPVPNPLYTDIMTAFATTTVMIALEEVVTADTSEEATSTVAAVATTTKESQGMILREHEDEIVAEWTRGTANIPFYFCVPERACGREVTLNTRGETPLYFDFFPGSTDLAIVSLSDGVYVTELDNRSGQNIQPLFEGAGADFRVVGGAVYVKLGRSLYEVAL